MKIIFQRVKNLKYAKKIYNVSVEKLVRKNSVNKKKFSYIEHINWLKKKIKKNAKEKIFLVMMKKKIIGIIRVKKKKFLSWVILKKFRNKKLGSLMLKTFVSKYKEEYYAQIKKNNIPSIKICVKAGFIKIKAGYKYLYFLKTLN